MGNLFYDEPRIEGKFKPGDMCKILCGLVNINKTCQFVEYTGADRNAMAYTAVDGPNPECRVKISTGYLYFAESDLELIAVQETQHAHPAAEPSREPDYSINFGPAIFVDRTPDQRFTGRTIRVTNGGNVQD